MSIELIVKDLNSVDENLRGYYKQDGENFKLEVNGAIPKSEFDAKEAENANLKTLAYAPDGKTFKEMFDGSQNANKSIRQERDGFSSELKKYQAIGKVEDIAGWKDEIESLKASGAKITDLQQMVNDLKKSNREITEKFNASNAKNAEYESANKALAAYKEKTEKALDMSDAESKISEVVDSIKGANAKALKRNLVDRYKDGTLIRDENTRALVTSDTRMSLGDYAKETMEAYGLFLPTVTGQSIPGALAGTPPSAGTQTTIESIAGMIH